ncbi:hypothetical protein ACIRBX_10825 [Kitasatospora sp. NPDC096147]|uniref:hypothetical protein n=1 Tax=Kitasatospora sp. NPDC096147 TaxID=3364093 RepID=UPI00380FDC1E
MSDLGAESSPRDRAGCLWLVVTAVVATVVAPVSAGWVVRGSCFRGEVLPWVLIAAGVWLALVVLLTVLGLAVERRGPQLQRVALVVLVLLTGLVCGIDSALGPLPSDDCYGNVP